MKQRFADVNQHVRRHREGDAQRQSGGRHGPVHGQQQPDARGRAWSKGESLSFPESVRELLRGDIGQPEGGWPADAAASWC
ncbi:MAG: hypothetical protein WKG07_01135 [Hymenobacter sp.]